MTDHPRTPRGTQHPPGGRRPASCPIREAGRCLDALRAPHSIHPHPEEGS